MSRSRWLLAGALCIGALGVAGLTKSGLGINLTASMPRGLWLTLPAGRLFRGEAITVCLPATWQVVRYVGPGRCKNGLEPVLKTIGAVEGDVVFMDQTGARVNDMPLPNTAPLIADDSGRLLAAWPFGLHVVTAGEAYLFSSHSIRSFDSRYVGPIKTETIVGRAVPVYVWDQSKE